MRPAVPLIGWGLALAAFAVGLLLWSGSVRSPWILLACSAVVTVLTGVAVGVAAPRQRDVRAIPDVSLAPTLTAFGVLLLLTAIAAGRWLVLLALGVIAVGLGGVVRELLAQRSDARR
ncbi:MAG TPA: hypothetical protein VGC71_11775 [Gaiellales bacterium]